MEVAEEEAEDGERAEEDEEHVGGEGRHAGSPHRAVVVDQPLAHRPAPVPPPPPLPLVAAESPSPPVGRHRPLVLDGPDQVISSLGY